MKIYKIAEINESLSDHIRFSTPTLCINHYFITCISDICIQLDGVCFKDQFYKKNDKVLCDIFLSDDIEKQILILDNLFINHAHTLFPLWFNKEISVLDLLEYYTPSVLINTSSLDNDIFSYTSDELSDESNPKSDDDESHKDKNDTPDKNDTTDKNDTINKNKTYINCVIPYDYEKNDFDIMIYNSQNQLLETTWDKIEVMNKTSICIIKFVGLKIEKDCFSPSWELIQLKLY